MNRVDHVERFLRHAGFAIASTTDFDEFEDGDAAIDLKDGRHIQIGHNYFIVYGKKSSRTAVLGPLVAEIDGTNLADLLAALKH